MNDEDTLLAAIRLHPAEDTPRLAYADWLDERAGDIPGRDPQGMRDRAALIRAQVQAATLPEGAPERTALEAQAESLLERHRPEWETSLRAADVITVGWERGFPASAVVTSKPQEVLSRLLAAAPITSLTLWGNGIGDEDARELAASPLLANLTRLELDYNGIGEMGLRALAASPHLKNLTSLSLWNIGTDVLALAESPLLSNLTALNLAGNDIGAEGVRALAESPNLKNLTRLDLTLNGIGDDGAGELARNRYLEGLTHLDLALNRIEDRGVQDLAESRRLRQSLTHLNLSKNLIRDRGARELAFWSEDMNLAHLDLSETAITFDGVCALARGHFRPDMTISVSSQRIGDGFEGSFAEFRRWVRARSPDRGSGPGR